MDCIDHNFVERAFDSILFRNTPLIKTLSGKYPIPHVDSLDSYMAHRCINIHQIFSTFRNCYSISIDKCSAYTFLRILADHIVTLILIYGEQDQNEKALRHFLNIADGCSAQIKALNECMRSKNVSDFERDNATKTIENEQATIDYCVREIKNLSIYNTHAGTINSLMRKNSYNWKYRSLDGYNPNKAKECSYSWEALYKDKLMLPCSFISNLSQYVHGLAGSVLKSSNIEIVDDTIKSLATLQLNVFSSFLDTHIVNIH